MTLASHAAHTNQSARSAPAAPAWTSVVFGVGNYRSVADSVPVLRREPQDGTGGIVEGTKAWLESIVAKPGPAPLFSHRGCPDTYCKPFSDVADARADLDAASAIVLAAIAIQTGWDTTVSDLWGLYLLGGTADPIDVSATLATTFTDAPSTAYTTRILLGLLRSDLSENAQSLRPVDQSLPRFSEGAAAIGTPDHAYALTYNKADGIPGNIAGGVGREQVTTLIGAIPSAHNDLRSVDLSLAKRGNEDGSITVTPDLTFTVGDTIDFCPGQCGTGDANVMLATTLLSRFEATALAGDVPFVVRFPAPADLLAPFAVAAPSGSPLHPGQFPTP